MKYVIAGTGLVLFVLGACCIGSGGIWQIVAGCAVLAGLALMRIGGSRYSD